MIFKTREALLAKIRGLLAKKIESNCTEEEALAALSKANAMMAAYEVSEDELNLTKEEKAILRYEPPGTKDPHLIKWQLLNAVAKFCGCTGWRRSHVRVLVFCGLPSDVQFATWLLETLTHFVQAEIVRHLMNVEPDKAGKREVIRSFVMGCTERISQRLKELCEQSATSATSNAKALVVVKDAAVQAKLDELGIKLSCGGGSAGAKDSLNYDAGRAAGDHASFGRPISGKHATLRLK